MDVAGRNEVSCLRPIAVFSAGGAVRVIPQESFTINRMEPRIHNVPKRALRCPFPVALGKARAPVVSSGRWRESVFSQQRPVSSGMARQQIRSGYPFSGARIFIPRQKPDRFTPESNLKMLIQPRGWSSGTTRRFDIRGRTPKRNVSVPSEAVQQTNPLRRAS